MKRRLEKKNVIYERNCDIGFLMLIINDFYFVNIKLLFLSYGRIKNKYMYFHCFFLYILFFQTHNINSHSLV